MTSRVDCPCRHLPSSVDRARGRACLPVGKWEATRVEGRTCRADYDPWKSLGQEGRSRSRARFTARPRTARQGRPQASLLDSVEKVLTAGLALGAEVAYGVAMKLSEWAENHAGDLLRPIGRRWRHAQAVAETARDRANGMAPEDADVLVAAAFLHDIGYAPELTATRFHPLDGATHLRALGHERLAGLVAHHTRARHEARLRGLESALSEFDDECSIVSAALAYCDLTTGPSGQRMTPEQRLMDVEARYGAGSPVTRGLRAAWPELMEAVEQVEVLRGRPVAAVAQPR